MTGTKSQAIFPGLLRSPVSKGGNLTADATDGGSVELKFDRYAYSEAAGHLPSTEKQIRLQTNESHMSLACPKKLKPPAKGNLEPWILLRPLDD